ncbi:phosphoesterase [Botrimarina hoheduenensis]|uniref:Phosphoesterase n=1 Tax=Botrimarina hoheduenensis TaxID=2528000 RepID=A0A5C5VVP6_9BACT|nr:phosphoesterase [Botrimarina hoheduenensis]TWT42746.1 hypothetical protein Pla111_27190 [Botrimarina hoheduenensis]
MSATSTVSEEQVLVVPTTELHAIGHFQGFSAEVDRYLKPLLASSALAYRPRSAMEEDPSFKQLIPYVLMRHTDSQGVVWLFTYQRGQGGGESRLRAKRSVGVGGHISTLDANHSQAAADAGLYRRGLERELAEEVRIEGPYREQMVGLINDDETPVGLVHLGVVHVFDVESPQVTPCEDDLADARFLPVNEILSQIEHYESWSQIAVRALFG